MRSSPLVENTYGVKRFPLKRRSRDSYVQRVNSGGSELQKQTWINFKAVRFLAKARKYYKCLFFSGMTEYFLGAAKEIV